jgi:hypothetical protein
MMAHRIFIRRISPHFVWIMGLLELITVPLVVIIPRLTGTTLKNPLHGIVVGFVGIIVLFCCINPLLSRLNISLMDGKIMRFSVLSSAFWSAFILALIFLFQMILGFVIPFSYPWKEIILGVGSAGGAVFCSSLVYRIFVYALPFLAVSIKTTERLFVIEQFSVMCFSVFAAIYEGVALPIISIWKLVTEYEVLISVVTGLAGGMAGALSLWLFSFVAAVSFGWITFREINLAGKDGPG